MLRTSLHGARLELLLTLAGVITLLGACTGTGGDLGTATPTVSLASSASPAAPSAAISEAPSGGGGRGDSDYDYGGAASAAVSPLPGPQAHQVNLATGPLGAYLTGDSGLTLYTFKPDSANTSTCTGGCAQTWLPFGTGADDTLEAGDGVGGALTTFARADGTMQVAYDGAPLYYFANDSQPGDTNGQGIGDAWFVAKP